MEQLPSDDKQANYEPVRPRLDIDLSGPDGNVFMVIGKARQQLEGEQLEQFEREINDAISLGVKKYHDILAIVNSYMDLTDTSGMYEAYAPKEPDA